MQLTPFERAVLEWIARRTPGLAVRLRSAAPVQREHTGAGFYLRLVPDGDAGWDRPPVDGPTIESPSLPSGGGSLLWLVGGEPACLEVYSHGDAFPEMLDRFRLTAT